MIEFPEQGRRVAELLDRRVHGAWALACVPVHATLSGARANGNRRRRRCSRRSEAIVAQLVRALVCGTRGRGFKSPRSPHFFEPSAQKEQLTSMTTPWGLPDFDAHEQIHFVTDEKCGLKAIIAIHSTHLGPAAGGARFWHYARDDDALTDALRLSRGMSYKNAMAGLPLGGGKSVLLADENRSKSPDMLHAFGKAVDALGGHYITAEDVGINVADMIEVARSTQYVAGLPNSAGDVGGDPGPHTSLGVFLGIKAAVKRALGKDNLSGLHIAMQGAGSVATGVALHACTEGARLSIADLDQAKAQKLADATNGTVVSSDCILALEADVVSPNALGAILNEQSIAALKTPIVAGGANNQLATPEDGKRLQ